MDSSNQRLSLASLSIMIAFWSSTPMSVSWSPRMITKFCTSLLTEFLPKDEGSIKNFFSINIVHRLKDDGSITIIMTPMGLIDQILDDMGLLVSNKVTQKKTPARESLLQNKTAAPINSNWNYHSVIGNLNFLAQNTCQDISMVVHMCARFVNNLNCVHQDAVKYLCWYLHYTCTQRLILKPNSDNQLNVYMDSDFVGLWSQATCQLRESAMSCTGYIIFYCWCLIHWVSKLQSEIALSTTKTQYIALSMCLQDLLPMHCQSFHKALTLAFQQMQLLVCKHSLTCICGCWAFC